MVISHRPFPRSFVLLQSFGCAERRLSVLEGRGMSEAGVTRNVSMLRVFGLVMILLALAGWGSFACATKTSAAAQQQLQEQVAELKVSQSQLIAERDQARAEMADLKAGRDQLMAEWDEEGATCCCSGGDRG